MAPQMSAEMEARDKALSTFGTDKGFLLCVNFPVDDEVRGT